MWTDITRRQYARADLLLPSDLSQPGGVDLSSYKDELAAARDQIILRSKLFWLGDRLFASGLACTISGLIINAIRRLHHTE